jgi:copper chaperone CopZ
MEEKTVRIPAISCGHCVMTIQRELTGLDGVEAVDGSPDTKEVTIRWKDPASWETIRALLTEIGYAPE